MALNPIPAENSRLHVKLDHFSSQPIPSGHRAFDQTSFLSAILAGHDAMASTLYSSYNKTLALAEEFMRPGWVYRYRFAPQYVNLT